MFGRKVREKRSLDDMFTEDDSVLYENLEESEEMLEDGLECAGKEITADDVFEQIKRAKGEPLKSVDCFGMEEGKTDKWLLKCAKFWFCCMSFLWFLFGALTFAPVIFISNKVKAVLKDENKSFLCGILIYCVFLGLFFILFF